PSADEVRDRRYVRRDAADIDDAILDSDESGELLLQLLMDRTLSRDDPTGGHGRPVSFDRFDRGRVHARVAGKSEIVVVRKVDQFPSVDNGGAAGGAFVDAEVRVLETVTIQLVETRLQQTVLREFICRQR